MTVPYTVIIPPDDPAPPPADRTLIAPDKIAADLMAAILANSTLAAQYTVTRHGATLTLTKSSGGFPSITIADTLDSTGGLEVINGVVAGWDELPDDAPEGFILHVAGDPNTDADDTFAVFTSGRWVETARPGVNTTLDAQRMPWALTKSGSGFTFGPASWATRAAGDNTNNPLPALDSVDLLFATEGRLGMTSGADIVLSAVGDPGRLFRRTVTQLLPDEPIGVRSIVGPESSYHTALQWDGGLWLWSDRAQVRLGGEPAITPTTVSLTVEARFENSPVVSPVVLGASIYFLRVADGCTRVFEFYRPPGYNTPPGITDVTADVPTYIQGTPLSLVGDDALGFLAVRTSTALYPCHFARGAQGQVQGRWHTWTFPGLTMRACTMAGGHLYLLGTRGSSTVLESLDVANPADLTSGTPADASGTVTFTPSWTLDLVGFRDRNGELLMDGRSTLRRLTIHSLDARSGTMAFADEATPRITLPPASSVTGDYPVPVMRTISPLRVVVSWFGTVTQLTLAGSYITRNRRL